MKKENLVTLISEVLGTTKVDAKQLLKDFDMIVEAVATELEAGAKAKLGSYIVIEKKMKEERTGSIVRVENGEKITQEYTVPAHMAISVKKTPAVKTLV